MRMRTRCVCVHSYAMHGAPAACVPSPNVPHDALTWPRPVRPPPSLLSPYAQIGFYSFIARPMFEAMDGLVSMARPLANLEEMNAYWTAQMPTDTNEPLPAVLPATRETPDKSAALESSVGSRASRHSRRSFKAMSRHSERSRSATLPSPPLSAVSTTSVTPFHLGTSGD